MSILNIPLCPASSSVKDMEDNQKIFVGEKEGREAGGRKGEMNNLRNSKSAYSMEI